MNTPPLVSVLMTSYNREKFIPEAIESVIASTYKNWELIIVDDCSTDLTYEIAKSYKKKDSRIKVYINEKNLGDYPNRNKAASYAQGKYLKYVDADDMIYPYGLEQLVFYMEQFPDAGYGLCSINQDKDYIFPIYLSPYETYKRNYFGQSIFHKAPLSSIIKKDAFCKLNGFANVRHYGDFEFWHRLSMHFSVVLMPDGIVWYRVSDGQEAAIRKKNPMNNIKTLLTGQSLINSDISPLNIEEKEKISRMYDNKISCSILSAFKHLSITKGLEMKKYTTKRWVNIIKEAFFC